MTRKNEWLHLLGHHHHILCFDLAIDCRILALADLAYFA